MKYKLLQAAGSLLLSTKKSRYPAVREEEAHIQWLEREGTYISSMNVHKVLIGWK